MSEQRPIFAAMLAAIRLACAQARGPEPRPVKALIIFSDDTEWPFKIPEDLAGLVEAAGYTRGSPALAEWEPTDLQADVLEALAGRALQGKQLASAVGCTLANLHKKPKGRSESTLGELQSRGLVRLHPEEGYYRADCPPDNLRQT